MEEPGWERLTFIKRLYVRHYSKDLFKSHYWCVVASITTFHIRDKDVCYLSFCFLCFSLLSSFPTWGYRDTLLGLLIALKFYMSDLGLIHLELICCTGYNRNLIFFHVWKGSCLNIYLFSGLFLPQLVCNVESISSALHCLLVFSLLNQHHCFNYYSFRISLCPYAKPPLFIIIIFLRLSWLLLKP